MYYKYLCRILILDILATSLPEEKTWMVSLEL